MLFWVAFILLLSKQNNVLHVLSACLLLDLLSCVFSASQVSFRLYIALGCICQSAGADFVHGLQKQKMVVCSFLGQSWQLALQDVCECILPSTSSHSRCSELARLQDTRQSRKGTGNAVSTLGLGFRVYSSFLQEFLFILDLSRVFRVWGLVFFSSFYKSFYLFGLILDLSRVFGVWCL